MPANKSSDFDIRHYWGIILRKKYLALAIAFSVISAFTLAGFILPKTYETQSTVAVEKSSLIDPLIRGVGMSSNVESGLSNLKNNITSRNIVERVVKKLDLDANAKNPNQYEALIEGIRQKLNVTVITILAILVLNGCTGSATQETTNTIDVTQRQVRNGTLYKDNEPNPYTGEVNSYYKSGQKASEEFYVDGKKQGKSLGWHENGQLKLEVHYIDGKEQGQAITWDENGQRQLEVNYVDGKVFQESDP